MSEKKADIQKQLEKENKSLREENRELKKFVTYVQWLKTDEEFLELKKVIETANKKLLKNR